MVQRSSGFPDGGGGDSESSLRSPASICQVGVRSSRARISPECEKLIMSVLVPESRGWTWACSWDLYSVPWQEPAERSSWCQVLTLQLYLNTPGNLPPTIRSNFMIRLHKHFKTQNKTILIHNFPLKVQLQLWSPRTISHLKHCVSVTWWEMWWSLLEEETCLCNV